MVSTNKRQPRLWMEALILLPAVFLTSILLGNQTVGSSDALHRLTISKELWLNHKLPESGSAVEYARTGIELKYGIVQPLAMMPFYGLGHTAAVVLGKDAHEADRWGERSIIELYTLAITLTLIVLVYLCMRTLRVASLSSAVWSWCLLFATPVGVYVRTLFSESLSAVFIVASIFFLLRKLSPREELAAYVCAGIAALNNPVNGLWFAVIPGLVAAYLRPNRWKTVLRWIAVAVPTLGIQAWYNWLRYGMLTVFGSDYRYEGFSTSILVGIYGLLFSVGRGLVIFSPLTVLSLLMPKGSTGKDIHKQLLRGAVFVLLFVYLAVYGKWWSWFGGLTWGPRFLIQVLPLFHVFGYYAVRYTLMKRKRRLIAALAICLLIGLILNGVEYSGNFMLDFINWRKAVSPDTDIWTTSVFIPHMSPIWRSITSLSPILVARYVAAVSLSLLVFVLVGINQPKLIKSLSSEDTEI